MNKEEIKYFKNKLNKEKERINDIVKQLNDNGMTKFNSESASELSFYDNHPADIASETFEVEKGRALEASEIAILEKINDALSAIEDGSYGKCRTCGKAIDKERLDFIPYAVNCIDCEDKISDIKTYNSNQRVVEEEVIGKTLSHRFDGAVKDDVEFDEEDSYEAVGKFNKVKNTPEYDYKENNNTSVEEIDKLSNNSYKNQLPD